ncbi:unnamed protein product [Nezara viridula]|uniref:Uncharacterized protein n=1 Tax=Nezara viridula TaxID=85310 RepID=A0A9P0E512_NEZVI|nr:unnamed protein product [Nezara viridula]
MEKHRSPLKTMDYILDGIRPRGSPRMSYLEYIGMILQRKTERSLSDQESSKEQWKKREILSDAVILRKEIGGVNPGPGAAIKCKRQDKYSEDRPVRCWDRFDRSVVRSASPSAVMIKVIILFIGAAAICYGRPPPEGSLHVVYSKMLSEVGTLQAEPRSGVAYVYSITAPESPSAIESSTSGSSDVLFPQEIDFNGKFDFKDNLSSLKQNKEKKTAFLYIDPLDPKANESGIS